MVMRKWIINYFIDEPEETTVQDEMLFYSIMAMPLVIAITTLILV